jgi:hypothetical protein
MYNIIQDLGWNNNNDVLLTSRNKITSH